MRDTLSGTDQAGTRSGLLNGPFFYVGIPLTILGLVIILPTVQLIYNSLHHWSLLSGVKRFVGLRMYVTVLTDSLFTQALWRTLIFTFTVVAIQLLLGLAIAIGLNRNFPGSRVLRTVFLTPMLMVPIMVGLLWSLMYQPSIGVVNYIIGLFGVEPIGWLSSSRLALPCIGVAEIWQWTPFVAIVFLSALQGLPPNIIAAARLDGAGRLRRLLTIELPMMWNVVAIVFLLRFIDVFKTFGLVYVMTRGGPGRATMLAGFYPWEVGFSQLLMGKASAAAFVLMNIISIMALILLRLIFRESRP